MLNPGGAAITRVGAYVDAFNLYYGGRELCGGSVPGWRWLDLEALLKSLIDPTLWPNAELIRIVYCTAPRDREGDPTSIVDQLTYMDAVKLSKVPVEVLEGYYVRRTKRGDLVDGHQRITSPGQASIPTWLPVVEKTGPGGQTVLRASLTTFEEKGSDVNVASSLLIDALERQIDAAIVVSNDSDLAYPLTQVRDRIPVGTVNPTVKYTARDLRGDRDAGAGSHWWRRLSETDFRSNQFPDLVQTLTKPVDW